MTYDRFKEIWTTLVTNRAPSSKAGSPLPLSNGASDHTIAALVAVANEDHSHFDKIQRHFQKAGA